MTDAAGGGGAGTEGDPWTLAEGFSTAVAGDRVNILSDSGYSIGATTLGAAGTQADAIVYRGYNVAIGDLETLGRTSTGALDTTGFPVITTTGAINPLAHTVFQNLSFTASINTLVVGSSLVDQFTMISCAVVNTANNSAAVAVQLDNDSNLTNSDFACTGAAHGSVVDGDINLFVKNCRVTGTDSTAACVANEGGNVEETVFLGPGIGIKLVALGNARNISHTGNTFYALATAIQFPAVAFPASSSPPMLINNHVTDCGKWLDNLYSGTSELYVIELFNRTRDNTTPRTGIGDGVLIGEVTTDGGGAETDFTNAGAGDFTLIAGAPGELAGMNGENIGAEPYITVGGGGGPVRRVGGVLVK